MDTELCQSGLENKLKDKKIALKESWKDKEKLLFSPGIEPGTFCVLDRCDNRYTANVWNVSGHFMVGLHFERWETMDKYHIVTIVQFA